MAKIPTTHDGGVVVIACVFDESADAGQPVEQFGGDHRRVGHADREPDAGERFGQRGRDDDVADDLRAGGAQRAGGLLQADGSRDHRGGGRDGGGRQRRQRQQGDLRRLVDAQPDDQQEEVGQRRQRAQEGQPRFQQAAHPADRSHDETEQDAERRRRSRHRRTPAAASCRGVPTAGSPRTRGRRRAWWRCRGRRARRCSGRARTSGSRCRWRPPAARARRRRSGTTAAVRHGSAGRAICPWVRPRPASRRATRQERYLRTPTLWRLSVAETKRKWFSDSRSRQTARWSLRY